MTTLTILAATPDHVDTLVAGQRHRVTRRAVAVALDYIDRSGEWTHPLLGGPRLSRDLWITLAAAMVAAEATAGTAERETIVNASDGDDVVRIWTAQRKVITAMRKRGATTEWAEFEVPGRAVPARDGGGVADQVRWFVEELHAYLCMGDVQ